MTGHLPARIPLQDVFASRVYDDIAHAEELTHALGSDYPEDEAGLDALAKDMKKGNVSLTTTIVNNNMIAEQVADFEANLARDEVSDAPPLLQVFWRSKFNPWRAKRDADATAGFARQVEALSKIAAGLHDRGVQLLAGTDAPNPTTVPGASLHQELEILVEAGLSPAEALQAATTAQADHFTPGARSARIETGAAAQFIATGANPLEDITALKDFDGLIVDGVWLSREEIETRRKALRATYEIDIEVLSKLSFESPQTIFDAIESSKSEPAISREGLTSLVWFYMKVGNLDAAGAVAEKLTELYPSPQSEAISDYIDSLSRRGG